MIHQYARVIRKDTKLILLVLIFIVLGILATLLANQCGFVECEPISVENPSIVNHASDVNQY